MSDGVALSALDWWAEAGVDTLADDLPRDWLADAVPAAREPAAPVEAAPASAALPATLAAFRTFLLAEAELPGGKDRIDAAGEAEAGIAVVVDMPEAEDRQSGRLLSGEIGALFDRMLAAIALERTGIYLIPFSPARPAAGRLNAGDLARLVPLLQRHLALAAPRKLLLLGDAPVQALLAKPAAAARDTVHHVAIGERQVPTVASIHPRLVHLRREHRPLVWADLQRFAAL